MKNSKFLAILFSTIPGAGHMYLGLCNKGLQLMALFFASIAMTSFLNLEIFAITIPIIWFYSAFDVRKCYNLGITEDSSLKTDILWKGKERKILGYIFIILGGIGLADEVLFPSLRFLLDWRTTHLIKVMIVSAIFIAIGGKLLMGKKIITDPSRLLNSSDKGDI